MFEEVHNDVVGSKNAFSENVRDQFGRSVCEQLYDTLVNCVDSADTMSSAADLREAYIRARLMELRMIL